MSAYIQLETKENPVVSIVEDKFWVTLPGLILTLTQEQMEKLADRADFALSDMYYRHHPEVTEEDRIMNAPIDQLTEGDWEWIRNQQMRHRS